MKTDNIIKKLSLKIRYLTLELEEVKGQLHVCNAKWMEYLYSLQNQHDITIFKQNTKKTPECEDRCLNDEIKIDPKKDRKQSKIFKDVYRDIAKITHPDVNPDDEDAARLMRQATEAKNNDDLITLLDICDDLDIEKPTLNKNHVKIIEKNIKKKEENINAIKNTDAWVWYHADEKKLKQIEKTILNKYKSAK